MAKYIFITGGVISSLGKGLATSSIGNLLKDRGLKVTTLKIDPYINVDPGTLSPYQHGEVFVTEDGAECDLDIGHYERFLNTNLSQLNNFTTGRVYESVIKKEREGLYLGSTVQVVPHITNEIIERIEEVTKKQKVDILITELGGTIGDIESLPFVEAIRQFSLKHKNDVLHIHLTLVPYIEAAKELKTKPAQHSVKKLNELGIWPKILMCRSKKKLPRAIKEKLSLFCNIDVESIVEATDVDDIYKIPIAFKEQKVDDVILKYFNIKAPKSDLKAWKNIVKRLDNPKSDVTIGVIGKYIELRDAYKSIIEAFKHAGIANETKVHLKWISAEEIEKKSVRLLKGVDGILVPGGFGERGVEGKISTIQYARENNIPFLGICLGLQLAVIEFARHILKLKDVNSTEFDKKCKNPVIDMMEDKKYLENFGGTLRLGAFKCAIKKSTVAHRIYKKIMITERHRHRYEVNNKYVNQLEKAGLTVSGRNPKRNLVEIVEIQDHPYFIAVQFHPELKSRPINPHPLFVNLVKYSLLHKKENLS